MSTYSKQYVLNRGMKILLIWIQNRKYNGGAYETEGLALTHSLLGNMHVFVTVCNVDGYTRDGRIFFLVRIKLRFVFME